MKTLINNMIKIINEDATSTEVNTMFAQFISDFGYTDLAVVKAHKIEVIKRYYFHKSELDTVYADLSFQADVSSRDGVITPISLKALQAQMENNTAWSSTIISNTKDADGLDIEKAFTATEMLELADAVTLDVYTWVFIRKGHCNAVELLTDVQAILDYAW